MSTRREKWPLEYAREIAALPSREARQAALAAVPADWRELVRKTAEHLFTLARRERARVPRVRVDMILALSQDARIGKTSA